MGNMKFDGADVTFELDGYDALVERVRSKKVNCKINPSDLPRLYAVMDAELEGNEELAAAFAEAQEAAFGEAVLTVWAERIKSFKDSFIPVFGEACKDAACRFGFSKDGNNTFKSAVDAFAANICDLYGAAPQIVDGFCEFLARNACLEFDGYAADCGVVSIGGLGREFLYPVWLYLPGSVLRAVQLAAVYRVLCGGRRVRLCAAAQQRGH